MNLENEKQNQNSDASATEENKQLVAKNSKIDSANTINDKKPFRLQDRKPNRDRPSRTRSDFRKPKEQSEFLEKVISIRRINRINEGGRQLRFSAAIVIGNKKGIVGLGVAKANEVNDAIKKAIADGHKNLKQIAINQNHSIYHHGMGNYCASKILLKPAKEGIGIKAGGSARDVIELAGIQNIYSKSFGSNNKINLARATINGLIKLKSEDYFKNKLIKRKPVISEAKK